jgi:hypothetical protein
MQSAPLNRKSKQNLKESQKRGLSLFVFSITSMQVAAIHWSKRNELQQPAWKFLQAFLLETLF